MAILIVACSSAPLGPLLVLAPDGAITVLDRDGNVLLLEEGGTQSRQPTWSPDGRLAVWTLIDSATGEFAIKMGDADHQRRIESPTAPFFYAWSPEGKQVAFLGNSPQGQGVALGLIDVAAGEARLIDGGAPYFLAWAPNGDRMAIHVANQIVAMVDLEGNRTELEVVPGQFQAPDFLADGHLIVVQKGPPQMLASVAPDGNVVSLTEVEGITMFSANASGGRIAFTDSSPETGLPELALWESGDGSATVIDPGPVAAFEWDPTGTRLLYLTVDVAARVLVPHVWEEGRSTAFPGFVPSAAFLTQYLPFWDQYVRSQSLWSPDGDSFVLPIADNRIVVQDLDQDSPMEVGPGLVASWSR